MGRLLRTGAGGGGRQRHLDRRADSVTTMAKRGRPTIGAEPMTPAERQRRRRAKMERTGPGRTGRPAYNFFGDLERYALARCELMIRQGKSERKALVIAAATTWKPGPDFVGPLLPWLCLQPDGTAVLYVPPGSVKVRAKGQVRGLALEAPMGSTPSCRSCLARRNGDPVRNPGRDAGLARRLS